MKISSPRTLLALALAAFAFAAQADEVQVAVAANFSAAAEFCGERELWVSECASWW